MEVVLWFPVVVSGHLELLPSCRDLYFACLELVSGSLKFVS